MPLLAEYLQAEFSGGAASGRGNGGAFGRTVPLVQVIDRTGIDGAWMIVLDYTPDTMIPSITASLQNQGIRLERLTAPAEKLVIDSVDRTPTAN